MLNILYNWYLTGTNLIDQLMNEHHDWKSIKPVPSLLPNVDFSTEKIRADLTKW